MKQVTTHINGANYTTTVFPARQGMVMQARIARLLGGLFSGIGSLGRGEQAEDEDAPPGGKALRVEELAGVLQGLEKLNPQEFSDLAYDMLAHTTVNDVGLHAVYDTHYAANYGELYKAVGWVIDANFGHVFGAGGIGGLTAKFKKLVSQTSAKLPKS